MSRAFNGGVANDRITFGSGSMVGTQGPITIAILAKTTSPGSTQWGVQGMDGGGFAKFGMLLAGGKLFYENDFSTGGPAVNTNWAWLVGVKAGGSVPAQWYYQDVDAAGPLTPVTGSSNVADIAGATTQIIIGGQSGGGASTAWRGSIAAAAVWNSARTQPQVAAACTLSAADLVAGGPKWAALFNQSSIATPVSDLMGSGNQVSISGTSVDASEPLGWSYSLGGGSPTVKVWNGSAELATAGITVWNGSTELPVASISVV